MEIMYRVLRPGIILFISAAITLSCSAANSSPESSVPGHDVQKPAHITGTGTVRYISLEGGFYGIIGDGGKKYLPLDLEEQYKTDGLKVRFQFKVRRDVMSIYMWGIPVEVVVIEKIE